MIGSSVATTLAVLTIARVALYSVPPKTIPSPLKTLLPKLSKNEQAELPYPPDVFPGARDINSPASTSTSRVHRMRLTIAVRHDKGIRMGAREW